MNTSSIQLDPTKWKFDWTMQETRTAVAENVSAYVAGMVGAAYLGDQDYAKSFGAGYAAATLADLTVFQLATGGNQGYRSGFVGGMGGVTFRLFFG